MTDKEPERYYDWILWKNRQEEAEKQKIAEDKYFDKKWEEHKKMLEYKEHIERTFADEANKKKIYESPDGGKTVYQRDFGAGHDTRTRVEVEDAMSNHSPFVQYGKDEHEVYLDLDAYRALGNVPEVGDLSRIEYKYNENQLIAEFKEYVDETYGMHYSKENFQATEFIIDGGHGTGFCIGNVLKYAQRYGKKGTRADARKDIMKVLHYALMQLYVHDLEDKK